MRANRLEPLEHELRPVDRHEATIKLVALPLGCHAHECQASEQASIPSSPSHSRKAVQDLPHQTRTMLLVSLSLPTNSLRTTANKDSLDAPLTRSAKPDKPTGCSGRGTGDHDRGPYRDDQPQASVTEQATGDRAASDCPLTTVALSHPPLPGGIRIFLPYQIPDTKKPVNPED